jgi:hypothetical protein
LHGSPGRTTSAARQPTSQCSGGTRNHSSSTSWHGHRSCTAATSLHWIFICESNVCSLIGHPHLNILSYIGYHLR